jgi:hypothetical protein
VAPHSRFATAIAFFLPFLTPAYGAFFNRRVRRQIRGIAAFLENPSVCDGDPGKQCVLSTDRPAGRDPALREAERRLQGVGR